MKELEIRKAKKEDCSLILEFIKELAKFEKLSHEVIATSRHLEETLFGEEPHAEVNLAFYENQPAGFTLFFYNYSTFLGQRGLYLEDLYVKEHLRGKGIGKALLINLAKHAVDNNCARFEWSVLDWNTKAIKFYESLGAKQMEEWTVHRVSGEELKRLANT
jgi:GNAT superfamily N-acetyltransferase